MNNSILTQTHGAPTVSEKYKVLTTQTLIQALLDRGYTVRSLTKANARKEERRGFERHLLRLQHPGLNLLNDGGALEVIVMNSYDAGSAMRVMLGVYRFACANGIIAGTSYDTHRVVHLGDALEQAITAVHSVQTQAPRLAAQIREFQGIELTESQRMEFAEQVSKLVLPKPKKDSDKKVISVDLNRMLRVRRLEDRSQDLYTVFNRLQECAVKGGLRYRTIETKPIRDWQGTVRDVTETRNNTTRQIKDIKRLTKVNQAVWDIAERFVA